MRMFDEQQRVGDAPRPPFVNERSLQVERLGVWDPPETTHVEKPRRLTHLPYQTHPTHLTFLPVPPHLPYPTHLAHPTF
jgi:hypothetical protein